MTARFDHDALQAAVYSDDAVLLLFGDDEAGLARVQAAVGPDDRVAGVVSLSDGVERLDRQVSADALVVVADAPSVALERLLARIDAEVGGRRARAIVTSPEAMIDFVSAGAWHPDIQHLVDPSEAELAAHIAAANLPEEQRVRDAKGPNGVSPLQQLSEDTARIAAALAALSEETGGFSRMSFPRNVADGAEAGIDGAHVRSIIRARRMRDQYFRGELFADPAFDMLLDLYAAGLEGNRVAVSSLCIAAAVPATTALRWIKALTDRGLFIRSADPQDGRRVYIELSADAARAMGHYLGAVQRAGITAI